MYGGLTEVENGFDKQLIHLREWIGSDDNTLQSRKRGRGRKLLPDNLPDENFEIEEGNVTVPAHTYSTY